MIFKFENLGFIDKGTLELGDLTVICGPNNVGKSYISYAIYGWLLESRNFTNFNISDNLVAQLLENGHITIDLSTYSEELPHYLKDISNNFKKSIASFFNVDEHFFNKTNVELLSDGLAFDFNEEINSSFHIGSNHEITYNKPQGSSQLTIVYTYKNQEEELFMLLPDFMLKPWIQQIIRHCLFAPIFRNSFPITSERTGISIFQKQLDYTMSSVLGSSATDANEFSKPSPIVFNYTKPITFNIDLVRSFESISGQKSFITKNKQYSGILDTLFDLMKGTCKVINDQLVYICQIDQSREPIVVPIHMASSAIKSLALIELYIRSLASQGDLLIIDEPEQNLHLSNQAKIAALISKLVNAGIKVLITTHSDTILRELNNRIMLSQNVDEKDKIMREANIASEEILSCSQVKAYSINSNHMLQEAPVNKYGISMTEIDDLIKNTNSISNDIFYNIIE